MKILIFFHLKMAIILSLVLGDLVEKSNTFAKYLVDFITFMK